MNHNNKNPLISSSQNKTQTENRVFARLISRSEIKKVSGGNDGILKCKGTGPDKNGNVQVDCTYT